MTSWQLIGRKYEQTAEAHEEINHAQEEAPYGGACTGTSVVWHRPSFDTKTVKKYKSGVVKRNDDGTPVVDIVHHKAEDFEGQCFGIMRRPGREVSALVRMTGKHGMSEVPLSQLTERGWQE